MPLHVAVIGNLPAADKVESFSDMLHSLTIGTWCAEQPEAPLQPVNPDRNLYEDDDRAYKKPKVDLKPPLILRCLVLCSFLGSANLAKVTNL